MVDGIGKDAKRIGYNVVQTVARKCWAYSGIRVPEEYLNAVSKQNDVSFGGFG